MIYLIKNNEIIEIFDNVINWGSNFVEFNNNGLRCKLYSDDDSYFTDINPNEKEIEETEIIKENEIN